MKRNKKPMPTGQQLVADFQSVILSLATAQVAAREAKHSEEAVLQQLSDVSRGLYLNPSALSEVDGNMAAHASLDAHVKKVQAEQLESMSMSQMYSTMAEDRDLYVGRKIRVTNLDKSYKPFDGVWHDSRTGIRSNALKKVALEGTIEQINFEKNMLVLQPKRTATLFNQSLRKYLVYVINPDTLMPAVTIQVLK